MVADNDPTNIVTIKQCLATHFNFKNSGPLKCFLGLEVTRSLASIFISYRKYELDILSDFGQLGSNLTTFLMERNLRLHPNNCTHLSDLSSYRRLVDCLLYFTITRPKYCFIC